MAHLIPGDPFHSEKLSEDTRQQIIRAYGLDKSIIEQYFVYVINFFKGDWGPSFARQGTANVTDLLFGYSNGNEQPTIPYWLQLVLVTLGSLGVIGLLAWLWSQRNKLSWLLNYRRLIIPVVITALAVYILFTIFTADTSKAGGFIFSLRLGIMAFIFMLIVGIPLGIIAALKQNTWIDYTLTTISLIAFSIPSFVLGLLALVGILLINTFFGTEFSIAPSSPTTLDLVLPAMILGAREASIIARLTRSSMLEVIRQDYMRTAQAKGLNNQRIAIGHGLKNAFIPILTVLGDRLAGLLTGSVTIESVFNIPGIGYYFVSSILAHDYPMILATTVLYALLIVVINLVVDLLYGYFDPRISYVKGSAA